MIKLVQIRRYRAGGSCGRDVTSVNMIFYPFHKDLGLVIALVQIHSFEHFIRYRAGGACIRDITNIYVIFYPFPKVASRWCLG